MPENLSEEKVRFLKLSPELADGQSSTLVPLPCQDLPADRYDHFDGEFLESDLYHALKPWLEECLHGLSVGEGFAVEIIEMSERDFAALPDL